jgi:hypothetical protein
MSSQRGFRFVVAVVACGVVVGSAFGGQPAASEDGAWTLYDRMPAPLAGGEAWIRPPVAKAAILDPARLEPRLAGAPMEFTPAALAAPVRLQLPMPDGTYATFDIVESPVMEPALAAKFPQIKTYAGRGVTDPYASVRMDWTPQGFHAQVLSPSGAAYIDPYTRGDTRLYSVYYKRDLPPRADGWACHVPDAPGFAGSAVNVLGGPDTGETLRTYRLACAATGEYTAFHGGTVAAGMSAITTAINRVTGVYQIDAAVRMVLVANNNLIVYTNGSTDPYTNNNGSTMLGQNQTNLDTVIGSANYDIGHVFSTGGGGIAGLGVVCRAGFKAQGVTGLPAPTGDPFYIDYVAHEMGHQYGANHTFNGTGGSCAGNRAASAAYEPGSASTIMGYAGICGADDLQAHSDPYFLHHSILEMRNYVQGTGNCAAQSATGNNDPVVSAGSAYTIPRSTPFQLTATGSDPNGDPLTYCWEQRNLGPAQAAVGGQFPDTGSNPIFRSWNPTTGPTRVFPLLPYLLSNTLPKGEYLPTTNRTLVFRVVARDNRAACGGVATSDTSITVNAAAGPFKVTSPNTNVQWTPGAQTVTWDVAGTNVSPISTANVRILLSTDGGNTFPTVLAASTPNDGSEVVTIPSVNTTTARIRVEAVGNVYFDVSDTNFRIVPPPCYPDCNGDGVLGLADFGCFQTAFALGFSYADCNGDGQLNLADFGCFQTKFALGCP